MIKRLTDIFLGLLILPVLILLMIFIVLAIKLDSEGSSIHWSKRIGKNNKLFYMPKFRSMRINTPQIATHLIDDPKLYLTKVGIILRRTSLDELPQIYSILKGDISFVGPRPALFNQDDLMKLRKEYNIDKLTPGLTGWAQVNGRDEINIPQKVKLDLEYLQRQSLFFDVYILWLTVIKVLKQNNVTH
jgi:O-antigen biosynthesis protein WbqP